MKNYSSSIINWDLHLIKVPKTKFDTKIDDPFRSHLKRWLFAKLLKIKRVFHRKY